jgi:ribose-phosphate pyrophosphokinase
VFQNILGTDSHPGSQQVATIPGAVTSVAELMVGALERAHGSTHLVAGA